MIKFEHTEIFGFEHAIRGMRNPMNSWRKSDSGHEMLYVDQNGDENYAADITIGPNDLDLMKRLRNAGTDHRKYLRMIVVYVDIIAPLYFWKEFDTYKVGTVANSCSTMHKIADKKFDRGDFSHDYIPLGSDAYSDTWDMKTSGMFFCVNEEDEIYWSSEDILDYTIMALNHYRKKYLETKDKKYWWQMIQLLPSSYNQKRTVMLNYEVLANIYKSRKNHKLDEWAEHKPKKIDITTSEDIANGDYPKYVDGFELEYFGFCDWIKTLPYSESITGEEKNRYFEHDAEPDKVGKQIATPDPSTEPEKVDGISNASLTLDDGVNPSIKFDNVVEASITLNDAINVVQDALKGPKFATREALDENGNTCRGRDKSAADVLFDTVYGLNLSWFKDDESFPDHYKKAMNKLNEGFKDKNNGKR